MSLRRRRALLPYLLVGPGLAWLLVFLAIPAIDQLWVSLQTGTPEAGFSQTYNWSVYPGAIGEYSEQLLRSVGYAAAATVLVSRARASAAPGLPPAGRAA